MYKPLADSTLLRMPKKEIIELLRTAEHNAKVSQEWVDQQAKNLKDWEPVVRCKDCKHLCVWNRKDIYAFCPKTNIVFLPFEMDTRTFFCGFGERKDGGNADENRDPEN